MNQSTHEQSTGRKRPVPRRRPLILTVLLALDAVILGGCSTLLIVNHILNRQLDVYAATQSMAAASTILDLMDDLLPLHLAYGGLVLVLMLATASAWTWMMTQSRLLRYAVPVLCLIILGVLVGIGLSRGAQVPAVPPVTPTPLGWLGDMMEGSL